MMRKIIDIHAHTSEHAMRGLHVTSAGLEDLESFAEGYNVARIVLMATYFPFKGTGLTNEDLLGRLYGDRSLFLPFGSLDVMNNFTEGLSKLSKLAEEKKIAGVKIYPGYQNFCPSDPTFFSLYSLAEEFNLSVAIHTGELHHCCSREQREQGNRKCRRNNCPIDQLGHLAEPCQMIGAIKAFPRVNFILAHLGNPYFSQVRDAISLFPNVYTDISGQFLSGTEEDTEEYRQFVVEQIRQILRVPRGIDRLMFGTDFPIQSYADSIALVKALHLSVEDEEKIFYGNAARLLGLS
ncbi:MAG TPA: amidohydrolase family protein [Candidatus Magasanikbacteria bacterium]|nr:amidohydrolase family protein [Candidatus Magasanikbacteria bacterium]